MWKQAKKARWVKSYSLKLDNGKESLRRGNQYEGEEGRCQLSLQIAQPRFEIDIVRIREEKDYARGIKESLWVD